MVQVSPKLSVVDLSVRGLTPGKYYASVRENGDISQGAVSTGGVWQGGGKEPRGRFGEFGVDKSGVGTVFLTRPVEIWELIGRSFVVSRKESGFAVNDPDTVLGVIARSAGVWENEKTVPLEPPPPDTPLQDAYKLTWIIAGMRVLWKNNLGGADR